MVSVKEIGENPRLVLVLLRKYWMLVLFTMLLGAGIAFTYNQCATPIYTSNISLLIWNRDIAPVVTESNSITNTDSRQVNEVIRNNSLVSQSLHVAQRLVPAFLKLINSSVVRKATVEKLYKQKFKHPLDYSFKCKIKINSCIMDVYVTSPDPALATAAASALTESFSAEQERLMHVKYIQAITPASVPDTPSWPRKKMILLLGLFLGALAGSLIAFFIELLDITIKTSDDIKAFQLLPLGIIPEASDIDAIYQAKKLEQHKDLHTAVEAIRVINTTIGFLRVNNPLKVISITSALPGSGKTTISIFLARAMAAAQKRVLIIDCDLRKPKIFKNLSLSGDNGLVQFLISPQGTDPQKFIHKNVFPGVDVMANSLLPPNPTELLGAPQFREMLEQLKNDYDCVLLDCPPGLNMADAMVIGNVVDGIVLLLEAGHTKIKEVEHLLDQFGALRSKIIGAVLNKVAINNSKYSYYRYSGRYKDENLDKTEHGTDR
jgi:capsular exopolysaccharide synthesis family protein